MGNTYEIKPTSPNSPGQATLWLCLLLDWNIYRHLGWFSLGFVEDKLIEFFMQLVFKLLQMLVDHNIMRLNVMSTHGYLTAKMSKIDITSHALLQTQSLSILFIPCASTRAILWSIIGFVIIMSTQILRLRHRRMGQCAQNTLLNLFF